MYRLVRAHSPLSIWNAKHEKNCVVCTMHRGDRIETIHLYPYVYFFSHSLQSLRTRDKKYRQRENPR